jgi:hypothetical protein
MSIYKKRETSTQKIFLEGKNVGFPLRLPLLESQKLSYSINQPQEWILQREDTYGIY